MATVQRQSGLDLGAALVEGVPAATVDVQVDEAGNHPATVRIDDGVESAAASS